MSQERFNTIMYSMLGVGMAATYVYIVVSQWGW